MLAVWRSRFGYSVRLGHCPEYFMMFNEARSQKSSASRLSGVGAPPWVEGSNRKSSCVPACSETSTGVARP